MTETQTVTLTKQTGTYLHFQSLLVPKKKHIFRVIVEPFVTSTLVFGFCYLVIHIQHGK